MSDAHPRFAAARRLVFATVLASYVLSFFHRTAPAAIAGELTHAFAISGTILGTLAATYFYVYTLLQIPVGVLADTLGPRRIVTLGAVVASLGSFTFALAPTWEIAAIGRTLVGVGVAVAFIAILKINAVWYPAGRFATQNGITMLAGNLGAVIAGAPLAWLVTLTSWRMVFAGLGVLSLALAGLTWWKVRDRPEALGFAPVHHGARQDAPALDWRRALRDVLGNPRTWPGFLVNVGVAGTYLAFAGLWAVPYLQDVHGMSRVLAAEHGSMLLLGVAIGALVVGVISDLLANRRDVMRAYTALYACSWLPWLLHVQWPTAATLAWFFLMGLVIPGFVLTWTVAKEVNAPEHSGIATSVVNVGIFLGAGILQPAIGWVLDRGRAAGDLTHAWSQAIGVLAAVATAGAACAWLVRESAPGTASRRAPVSTATPRDDD
ncbi:MAG: MFS transporter [Casimicrobiaceae bacterium]